MVEKLQFKSYLGQVFALSLVTFIFAVPKLYWNGTNIVTKSYQMGATRYEKKSSPYDKPIGGADYFKYSPLFAKAYLPLSRMYDRKQALVWGFVNALLFWVGVLCWFRMKKGSSFFLWMAWLFCAMELNGPLLYQQINPALIGTTLLGLALYRWKHYLASGVVLAIATNVKILPAIFMIPLLFPIQKKYWVGCALGMAGAFLVPTLDLGWEQNLKFHQSWISLLLQDSQNPGILDIETIFSTWNLPTLGKIVRALILCLSLAMIFVLRFSRAPFDWPAFIAIASGCALLVSPRTESPTFILIAPAYLFMTYLLIQNYSGWIRSCGVLLVFFGIFLTTISYNDVWPKWLWNPHAQSNASKTLGVLLIWLVAIAWNWLPMQTRSSREVTA